MAEEYILEHAIHGRKIARLWAEVENDMLCGWTLAQEPVPVPLEPVDVNNVRWDTRIHQKNKAKDRDGQWKRKKGVSNDTYYKIITETVGT